MATVRLTCPCGHAWSYSGGEPIPADLRRICPVCSSTSQNTEKTSQAVLPGVDKAASSRPPSQAHAAGSGTFIQSPIQQAHSAAESVAATPGRVIAGFEILEELNRGGMGVIYKARQIAMNRVVALKAINPSKLELPGTRSRFESEVRASARVNHPNIVTVYATDLDGPFPYLAMEYVPGIDLLRLVRKIGPLPITDAVYYIRQAAEGLQHAFEEGLVHRDIKPSNLMVSPAPIGAEGMKTGKLPRVKILDMGLARVLTPDGKESDSDLTQAGLFLGTPDYVSPEQAEDARQADIRSDIFSLGGTLFFLLTGEVPFPGKTLVEKVRKAISEPTPSPAARRKDVPVGLEAIVRKMLAPDPDDRYQNPGEVVIALDRILRGEGGPAVVTAPLPPPAPTALVQVRAHTGAIRGLAMNADTPFVVTGGEDCKLRLWEPAKLKELKTFSGDLGAVEHLALAPGGKWAATCCMRLTVGEMGVQLWDLHTGAERRRLRGPADNIRRVAVSQDGKAIVAGADDGLVWMWSTDQTGPRTVCLKGHAGSVTGLLFIAPDSLLSAGVDGTVRQWDLRTGKTKGVLPAGAGPIAALAFGGKRVAAAGEFLSVRQPSGNFVRFAGHTGDVLCVAFSPDGRLLASGGADRTIRVWSAEEGAEVATYTVKLDAVRSLLFAPDGRALFSGGGDGTLSRWPAPVI